MSFQPGTICFSAFNKMNFGSIECEAYVLIAIKWLPFFLGRQNSSALDRTGSSSAPEVQLSKWCVELWYPSLGDNVIRRETILGLEQLWCECQTRLRVSVKMGQIDWISVTRKPSLLIYLHYNNFWQTTGSVQPLILSDKTSYYFYF